MQAGRVSPQARWTNPPPNPLGSRNFARMTMRLKRASQRGPAAPRARKKKKGDRPSGAAMLGVLCSWCRRLATRHQQIKYCGVASFLLTVSEGRGRC
jgi:hypothetical protein